MQLENAEKYITGRLTTELSAALFYHDYHHTFDVVNSCRIISEAEGITDPEDLLILKTAALYHDSGFLKVYDNHEDEGCRIAREMLPGFDYSEGQIDVICDLIQKTRIPQLPVTHLERILCDADLDHLGREDFDIIGEKLYKEWVAMGKHITASEWNDIQIKFLESHHFWTKTSVNKRSAAKQVHLDRLKALQTTDL